jgi:hypothetical protein
MLRFHTPARQTGRADFPHPAFGQGLMRSPTERCGHTSGAGPDPAPRADNRRGSVSTPTLHLVRSTQPLTHPLPDILRQFAQPGSRAIPSLWHATSPVASQPFSECSFSTVLGGTRLTPLSWLSLLPTLTLTQGPFAPPALPGFFTTTGLSATPYGPACPSRESG